MATHLPRFLEHSNTRITKFSSVVDSNGGGSYMIRMVFCAIRNYLNTKAVSLAGKKWLGSCRVKSYSQTGNRTPAAAVRAPNPNH